jgi:putative transposase
MSRAERRALIDREAPGLPVSRQCRLLSVSRASVYRRPAKINEEDCAIMALIDRQYLARPYYGSRRMAAWLATQGHVVNRKRVRRLMRLAGLAAIYQRPNTSKPAPAHKIYPYLLGGIAIERVNQVWCADVTYIPMAKGFLYLVVIMDWVSRAVLAWRLSNTLGAEFCVEALEEALARHGQPAIFNTDQGSQFTSDDFTGTLQNKQNGRPAKVLEAPRRSAGLRAVLACGVQFGGNCRGEASLRFARARVGWSRTEGDPNRDWSEIDARLRPVADALWEDAAQLLRLGE